MRATLLIRQHRNRPTGFTLIELLVAMAVLGLVLGTVFTYIGRMQRTYKTEETKLDAAQESRDFLDAITREVHQAGFPSHNLYGPGVLTTPTANDFRNAVGLVMVSGNELRFEGDINYDGVVESVRYRLQDRNGNPATSPANCPCTLWRSQVPKQNNTPPMAQPINYTPGLDNVTNINLFSAFNANGDVVGLPVDVSTVAGKTTVASIRTVAFNVNVATALADSQTGVRLPVSMTTTAKINNY